MKKLTRLDWWRLALISVLAILARPIANIAHAKKPMLDGDLTLVCLYAMVSILLYATLIWSLSRGLAQAADWGLARKYLWPFLAFVSVVIIAGFVLNTGPQEPLHTSAFVAVVALTSDIATKALPLALLSRLVPQVSRQLRVILVIGVSLLVLYPGGLSYHNGLWWVIWTALGVVFLEVLGTIFLCGLFSLGLMTDALNGAVPSLTYTVFFVFLVVLAYWASRSFRSTGAPGNRTAEGIV